MLVHISANVLLLVILRCAELSCAMLLLLLSCFHKHILHYKQPLSTLYFVQPHNRFWGTPIPIWASEDGEEIRVIGSIQELEEVAGRPVSHGVLIFKSI